MNNSSTLEKKEIIAKFAETLGMADASKLVNDAAESLSYGKKNEFNKEETLKVLELLRQKGGMVAILAGFMVSEAYLMRE